jgi:hypothetical protein
MANRNVKIVVTDGGSEVTETVITSGFGSLPSPASGSISEYRSSKDVVVLRAVLPNNSVTYPMSDLSFNWYYLDYKCNDASFANTLLEPSGTGVSGELLELQNQTFASTDPSWSKYKWTYTSNGNCGAGFFAVQNSFDWVRRFFKVEVLRKMADGSWNYYDTGVDYDNNGSDDTVYDDYKKSTGVTAVVFDTVKLNITGGSGLIKQTNGTFKRDLCVSQFCIDASHSCVDPGFTATYILFKDCVPVKTTTTSPICVSTLADGDYYVHSIINYADYCLCFETKSNTITVSGDVSGSVICPPPGPNPLFPCTIPVSLCAVNISTGTTSGIATTDNNANLNLANDRVFLYINYTDPSSVDTLAVYIVEESNTGADVYVPVDVSGLAWNKRVFEAKTGGCYAAVLTRPSADPCVPIVCEGRILVENGKDCNNFCLKFKTGTSTFNVNATTHEDDNEHDQLMSYYCLTDENLCDLVDISYNNVYLQKMEWNSTTSQWECKDGSTNDIDGSQYLTVGPSGEAYSGWVLYKLNESLIPTTCVSSGSFDASLNPDGTIVLNFEKLFNLENVICDPDTLFADKYQMCIYSSNGCVCATFNFKFVRKLTSVIVNCPNTVLECGKSIDLSAAVLPASTAVDYQWYLNGKKLVDAADPTNFKYTRSTLKLEYTDEAGLYQVRVTSKGIKTELCDVYACKGDTLMSNTVTVLKKFGVEVQNLADSTIVDKNNNKLVDVSKDIKLKANVLGVTDLSCVKYQWYLLDCDGNYILDKVAKGANDGTSDVFVRCPIGNKQTLDLTADPNKYINKQFEVTVTILTTGYKPLLNTTSLPTFLVNGITCVRREKVVTVRDTIKSTQNICIQLNPVNPTQTNLLCYPTVAYKVNFCDGFNFNTFDASFSSVFNTSNNNTNLGTIASGAKIGTGGLSAWKVEYLTEASYNTLSAAYVTDCPTVNCQDWWKLGTGTNKSDIIDHSHATVGSLVFTFKRSQANLQEGYYKLFLSISTESKVLKSKKGENSDSQYFDDCDITTCAVIKVIRSLKPTLVSCEESAGDNGITEYFCGDCSSSEVTLDGTIPFHLQFPGVDTSCVGGGLPDCFQSATIKWTYTDFYDVSQGKGCKDHSSAELVLGYSTISDCQPSVTVNFKKLFEDASRCVFWNCNNMGTFKAYIAYWDGSTNLVDGTIADISNMKLVCTALTQQVYLPKNDSAWEVASYSKLKQKLGVKIDADPRAPNKPVVENATAVDYDASGICMTVNVCGVPKRDLNNDLITNSDLTYTWYKGVSGQGPWVQLAAPTTFNKVVLYESGTYKVEVSKLIAYWDSCDNIQWCNNQALIGSLEDQCAKNEHIIPITLNGTQIITINPKRTLITNVAIRPTSRNVLSINGDAAVVNNTSNLGRLRAYVLPEDPTFKYQWYKNGAPIKGATESSYLPKLTSDVSGDYTVRVTSHHNSVVSKTYNITYQ